VTTVGVQYVVELDRDTFVVRMNSGGIHRFDEKALSYNDGRLVRDLDGVSDVIGMYTVKEDVYCYAVDTDHAVCTDSTWCVVGGRLVWPVYDERGREVGNRWLDHEPDWRH